MVYLCIAHLVSHSHSHESSHESSIRFSQPATLLKQPAPKTSSKKPAPGRPRTLDQAKRNQITAMIAGGCSLRDAAHFVRCSYDTIRRERKRDPQFKDDLRRSELYAQLSPLRVHAAGR